METRPSAFRRLGSVPRWPVPDFYNVADGACDWQPADKLAMIFDDDLGTLRNVHWGELRELSSRIANALVSLKVTAGDRVVAIVGQSPEAAAAILAVLRSGAVLVTMSELLADRQIHDRLAELDARVLITESRLADRFSGAVPITLLLDKFDPSGFASTFDTVRTPARAPAFIAYTSGTTGPAKGVMLPHCVMLAGDELSVVQDLRDGELFYGIGDWSWWVRKILGPWQQGAVNLVYKYERYDPEKLLFTLARHGVTNAFINATAIRIMMRDRSIGAKYPQRFRVVTTSNEPLGAEPFEWFREQFQTPPLEFYGCTEVGVMIGASPHLPVKPGSMGTAIPGWQVRILDEEGREMPPGNAGEICLLARSNPNYPLGYWRRPDATQQDFGGTWFHTKDIASVDGDGYFWYLGRKDDVIKSAGYRIGPHEVEATLRRHPLVLEAAVIGVPDAERGSRIVAYAALREGFSGSDALADELRALVRQEHSAFAYPREVHFVADLPRSSTGKIDRASLRRRHGERGV